MGRPDCLAGFRVEHFGWPGTLLLTAGMTTAYRDRRLTRGTGAAF